MSENKKAWQPWQHRGHVVWTCSTCKCGRIFTTFECVCNECMHELLCLNKYRTDIRGPQRMKPADFFRLLFSAFYLYWTVSGETGNVAAESVLWHAAGAPQPGVITWTLLLSGVLLCVRWALTFRPPGSRETCWPRSSSNFSSSRLMRSKFLFCPVLCDLLNVSVLTH